MAQKAKASLNPKQYHELTFTDNFMFCKIMTKNPDLCRQLLELILNVKIRKIVSADSEETLAITPEGKSVRLDVYVEDEADTVYDIEMQASSQKNLPKRTRYYQGIIDLNLIGKGMDYSELKRSFVIFICTFDYFKKGIPIYTFTNRCRELPELELGDDTVKIFINPYGEAENLSDDMKAFLKYLKGELTKGNAFVDAVEREVISARNCKEWKVEYMTLMMEYRERYHEGRKAGFEQGMAEGIAEGMAEGIAEGIAKGIEQGVKALIESCQELGVSYKKCAEQLKLRFSMTEEEAGKYMDQYWTGPVPQQE